MSRKLRITRTPEADELLAEIRRDDLMVTALQTALREMWSRYKAEFAAAGRGGWDPSPMLLPPVTDLLIGLIEKKVETLKEAPQFAGAAEQLDRLSKKASLYFVVDDLLQQFIPDYTPMSESGHFEIVTDSQSPTPSSTSSPSSTGCLLLFVLAFAVIAFAVVAT